MKANNTDLVKQLKTKYETKTFAVGGNISWIGNKSIIFAKYIRLVPTDISGSGNKTCIRVTIYGCSAGKSIASLATSRTIFVFCFYISLGDCMGPEEN